MRPVVRWILLLTLALGWRLLLFVGPQGSDDLVYSERAQTLAGCDYRPTPDIFSLRVGYLAPISLFYALFGPGSFSLVLFNLVCSLAGIILAWHIARRYLDEAGSWTATGLVALFPLDVFFATEAHPDMPLAVLTGLAILLYLKGGTSRNPRLYLASGVVLGAAHLVKETAFFGGAALLVLGARRRPVAWTALGFGILLAIECLFYGIVCEDPLYRFHTVQSAQAQVMNSESYLRNVPTFARLFLDVPLMLFYPAGGGFPFFALLPWAALCGAVRICARRDGGLLPLVLWPAATLLLLNFWPIQLLPYRPAMVAHPRIFLPLILPFSILAAHFLRSLPPKRCRLASVSLVLAAVLCSWILHMDGRRFSAGARLAWHHLPADATVVTDPRTEQLFRLYDGYRDSRPWRDWLGPEPPSPYVRVTNEFWERLQKEWHGTESPGWFRKPASHRESYAIEVRPRLRSLFRGTIEYERDGVTIERVDQ